jgi:hypothetical protein
MGGGLERRCVGRVYGVDGAVHGTKTYLFALQFETKIFLKFSPSFEEVSPSFSSFSTCLLHIFSQS